MSLVSWLYVMWCRVSLAPSWYTFMLFIDRGHWHRYDVLQSGCEIYLRRQLRGRYERDRPEIYRHFQCTPRPIMSASRLLCSKCEGNERPVVYYCIPRTKIAGDSIDLTCSHRRRVRCRRHFRVRNLAPNYFVTNLHTSIYRWPCTIYVTVMKIHSGWCLIV